MAHVNMTWQEGLVFEVQQDGHTYLIDGGVGKRGVTPKALLLTSLAGCAGMDVAALLKKMRVENYKMSIDVKATLSDEHPKVYTDIELIFNLKGEVIPPDKAGKAVDLSINRYCPVYAMLSKAATITTKLYINNEEIDL